MPTSSDAMSPAANNYPTDREISLTQQLGISQEALTKATKELFEARLQWTHFSAEYVRLINLIKQIDAVNANVDERSGEYITNRISHLCEEALGDAKP